MVFLECVQEFLMFSGVVLGVLGFGRRHVAIVACSWESQGVCRKTCTDSAVCRAQWQSSCWWQQMQNADVDRVALRSR